MNELALFAGAGGGILGGKLLGWRTVCAVEIEPYARRVLMSRQDDGCLDPFPIWDDVRTFDGKPWRGLVDVVSGGFPCQDISAAGKGAGISGERSGLWAEMARIIREVEPRFVLVENSPMLVARGLGRVLGDLASMGYNAEWGVLGADDAIWNCCDPFTDHERARIWICAHANHDGDNSSTSWTSGAKRGTAILDYAGISSATYAGIFGSTSGMAGSLWPRQGLTGKSHNNADASGRQEIRKAVGWWATEPRVDRMVHGVASRVDRLRCLGNGQVPAVVRLAWETLMNSNQPTRSAEESNT